MSTLERFPLQGLWTAMRIFVWVGAQRAAVPRPGEHGGATQAKRPSQARSTEGETALGSVRSAQKAMQTHARRRPLGAEVFPDGVDFRIEARIDGVLCSRTSDYADYRCRPASRKASESFRSRIGARAPLSLPARRRRAALPQPDVSVPARGAAWCLGADRAGALSRTRIRRRPARSVLYALHVGTFTRAATYAPPSASCMLWPRSASPQSS